MKQELIYTQKKELPKEWRWSTLGEECEINPRRSKDLEANDNKETSFVPMEAVDGDRGIISEIRTVPFSKVKKGYTYFEENDVLFAKITPCMQNKKSAIANDMISGYGFGTTEFHVLRCKEKIIPKWVYYFIRNQRFIDEAENNFTGAVGQQRVPTSFLENYPIIVPPIVEQQKIVDKLDKQMTQIEMMKKEAEKQNKGMIELKKSFSKKIFDSEKVKKGEVKSFGEITINYDGKRVPLKSSDRMKVEKKYPYYGASGIIDYVHDFIYDQELLLIGEDGENLRSRIKPIAFLAQGKYWVNNHAHVIDAKSITSRKYLLYYINSIDLKPWVAGAAQPKLNQNNLNTIPVPIPSKEIQDQIITEIEEFEKLIDGLTNIILIQKDAFNQLPNSILNEVFGQYQIQLS